MNDALKRKLEEIAGELKKVREAEEAEEERMKKVMEERINVLNNLGMVEVEERCEFVGFGLKYDVSDIYEAETMEFITGEINTQIETVKSRIETIKKIGYKFDEKGFEGFGVTYCLVTIEDKDEKQFEMFVKKLDNIKKTDKAEKAKNKRIKPERELLVDFIENGIRRTTLSATLKQPEMIEFKSQIESKLNGFCDSLIETLKSK